MWRGHSAILSPGEVARRAAGRRQYNSIRRCRALVRRQQVAELLMEGCPVSVIASALSVHVATIYGDIRTLGAHADLKGTQCPTCLRP